MLICIAPHRDTPLRHSGMESVFKESQFYLHTPRSSTNGMNHTCLFLPSRSQRMEGLGGWLHTEING